MAATDPTNEILNEDGAQVRTKLNFNRLRRNAVTYEAVTSTHSVGDLPTDPVELVLADATSGAFSVTLPTLADNTGRVVGVMKTDAGGNAVTIDGEGAETINGATTKALAAQYDVAWLLAGPSEWLVIHEA